MRRAELSSYARSSGKFHSLNLVQKFFGLQINRRGAK